jgi:hypothetical protein
VGCSTCARATRAGGFGRQPTVLVNQWVCPVRRSVVLSIAVVLLVGCSTASPGGSAAAPTSPGATPTLRPTVAPAVAQTPTIVTAAPTPTEAPRQAVTILDSGFSTFEGKYDNGPQLGFGIVMENPNAGWVAGQVDLSIAFLDGQGDIIDTADASFAAILPGQRVAWADTLSDYAADWTNMASMEISVSEPDWEEYTETAGAFSFTKTKMTRSTFGDIDVTARLGSTFEQEMENPYLVVVFYRADKIIGGAWTFLEHARDGAAVKINARSYPKVDNADLYGALTNLSLY